MTLNQNENSKVYERPLQCTFSTLDEYLDLFLTRVDSLRRRILSIVEQEGILDFSLVRETFKYASDYLSPQLKNTDNLLRLYGYWARLELNLGKDVVAARGVWENFLKMCILVTSKQEFKPSAVTTGQKEYPVRKNAGEKRKGGSNISDAQSPPKKKKMKKTTTPTQKTEQDMVQHQAPEKDHGDETDKLKDNIQNTTKEQDKRMEDSDGGKTKLYRDQCTIFISNLNFKANSEDIRKFCADVGVVVSIPILHDKFTGKSRGLAYVDFSDDEHLAAAVAKNKQTLLGKRLSIARSNPKKGKKGGQDGGRGSNPCLCVWSSSDLDILLGNNG